MRPEICTCGYLGEIWGYTVVLSLHTPTAHFGAKVYCLQSLPEYKHITLFAPGLGTRDLVRDNDGILHMLVHGNHP